MLITHIKKTKVHACAWFMFPIFLAACGGGAANSQTTPSSETSEPAPIVSEAKVDTTWQNQQDTVAFLNRATFGVTPSDITLGEELSASEWFISQLNAPAS